MKINFDTQTLEINPSGDNYVASVDGKTVSVQIVRADAIHGRMDLLIDGERVTAYVSSDMAKRWVTINGHTLMLTKTSGAKQGVRHDHAGGIAKSVVELHGANILAESEENKTQFTIMFQ